MSLTVGPMEAGGLRVTFEGRTSWVSSHVNAAGWRGEAGRLAAEAEEKAYRARKAHALAEHFAALEAERAEAAATQRRERAAATRAKNRDPWGFDALVASMAEPEGEGR